jgi:hypothetical protein
MLNIRNMKFKVKLGVLIGSAIVGLLVFGLTSYLVRQAKPGAFSG